jgi:hypothetical protein
MLNRGDFRAIGRSGLAAASDAALILGGLLLLSAP